MLGTTRSTPNSSLISAVLRGHGGEPGDEQLLLHRHHVFVAVDPADLGVDTGVLGGVARGERRIGAEDRADVEDLATRQRGAR
jgi:hypothetical protein